MAYTISVLDSRTCSGMYNLIILYKRNDLLMTDIVFVKNQINTNHNLHVSYSDL